MLHRSSFAHFLEFPFRHCLLFIVYSYYDWSCRCPCLTFSPPTLYQFLVTIIIENDIFGFIIIRVSFIIFTIWDSTNSLIFSSISLEVWLNVIWIGIWNLNELMNPLGLSSCCHDISDNHSYQLLLKKIVCRIFQDWLAR